MRNLLIGNGLNLTNYEENAFLRADNIYDRFIENLTTYWNIINKIVYQSKMELGELIQKLDCKTGIEKLAGITFQYIYDKITLKREFTWNDAYRLVEILDGRDIYKELDALENIDIFGMSPDGDESIIDRIKNIKNKKIYVYKLNEKEIKKWKNYGIEGSFIDSSKFLNN